jgi:hypothetical protein
MSLRERLLAAERKTYMPDCKLVGKNLKAF